MATSTATTWSRMRRLRRSELRDVADLPGSGEADNVAASGKRADATDLEAASVIDGARRVRFVFRLLGLSFTFTLPEGATIQSMALVDRNGNPIGPDQLPGSSPTPGLAN